MASAIERLLGWMYPRIPVAARPLLKRVYLWLQIRVQGLLTRRVVRRGRRVTFVNFEIADFEPFEYLSADSDEVEVVARRSTVSPGTERAVLCGLPGSRRAFPYIPGYSCAGEVVGIGSNVRDFQVGDRIAGRIPHVTGGSVKASLLFRIPEGVSLESASFLELGIICLQGVRKARIAPGDRVAVLGQGLIGQLTNRMARAVGAASVVAIAPSSNRAATALLPGGADQFVAMNGPGYDPSAIAADIVIEAVGSPDAITTAVRCARPGGRVVLLGSSRGLSRNVDLASLLQTRNIELVGAHISDLPAVDSSPRRHTYRHEGITFLELLRLGSLSVDSLVTWRPTPDTCNKVYEVLARGGQEHVAIVFDWERAPPGGN